MVFVAKWSMTIIIAASMLSGGDATRHVLRQISRRNFTAQNASKVVTAQNASKVIQEINSTKVIQKINSTNSSKSVVIQKINSTNSSKSVVMANPRPAKLRICNAYRGQYEEAGNEPLTATVGYPKVRVRSSAPAKYKDCLQMVGEFKAGDTVELYFGDNRKTAVYLPYDPLGDHSVILLVVFGSPKESFDIKIHYFRNLKYPQVTPLDVAPAGSPPAKIGLRNLDKKTDEKVEYDRVGPIDPGAVSVLLDGKPATNGQFKADWGECYAVMRVGVSEVTVWPASPLSSSGRNVAVSSLTLLFLWLSIYV